MDLATGCYRNEFWLRQLFKVELGEVVGQSLFFFSKQGGAIGMVFDSFDHPNGEDHAGWKTTFFTVGLGQEFQDIDQGRLSGSFNTRFDLAPVLPGIVDFSLQLGDDHFCLLFVLKGVHRDFPGMDGDHTCRSFSMSGQAVPWCR
jgi:hypothetical protein